MIKREREPGERADPFCAYSGDAWYELSVRREDVPFPVALAAGSVLGSLKLLEKWRRLRSGLDKDDKA